MCGFGGIVRFDGGAVEPDWLGVALQRLACRGPDGRGVFIDAVRLGERPVTVGLAHARLAIVDVADGAQPMIAGQDGRLRSPRSPAGPTSGTDPSAAAVVFNGCIYNHRGLRRELQDRGAAFSTDHSDTEVLIHGQRAWGDQLPGKLEGMFAYALWDGAAGAVTLARDRAGEKPLYWWTDDSNRPRLACFGSTVPAVRALAEAAVGRRLEIGSDWWIDALMYGWCVRELPWIGLREVEPGSWLRIGPTGIEGPHRYWPTARERLGRRDRRLTADELDGLIADAVRLRLESDVPVGCFLSGGVDSSLVAAQAQRAIAPLRTFSLRLPDADYDESAHAESVARHLRTQHRTFDVQPNPAADLQRLVQLLGLPFGDSSILPTHWIATAARAEVKVALSGDGGDELFIGYERYRAADWLTRHRTALALLPAVGREERSTLHRAKRLGVAARNDGYLDLIRIFPRPAIRRLVPDGIPPTERVVGLDEAVAWDVDRYLPGDLLRKVDTASMSVGLEARAPLLDSRLIEAGLTTRVDDLCPARERKGLLRAVARRHLPARTVDRPKMGFAVPIGRWFRSDFGGLQTVLLDHLIGTDPFGSGPIDVMEARRLADDHLLNRADHGQRLFLLLSMMLWVADARS